MATKIICRASDCIFWEDKLCTSEEITYDPEEGCLTYEVLDDVIELEEDDEDEWEDEELIDDEDLGEEDDDLWEEDDDLFLEEDDDEKWRF
ncbi:MAG: hypothetical protein FOGNACKC_00529 [Anaerolineae bacterium]|nr:hypothetical protein [Anaerolineae bacterium]